MDSLLLTISQFHIQIIRLSGQLQNSIFFIIFFNEMILFWIKIKRKKLKQCEFNLLFYYHLVITHGKTLVIYQMKTSAEGYLYKRKAVSWNNCYKITLTHTYTLMSSVPEPWPASTTSASTRSKYDQLGLNGR